MRLNRPYVYCKPPKNPCGVSFDSFAQNRAIQGKRSIRPISNAVLIVLACNLSVLAACSQSLDTQRPMPEALTFSTPSMLPAGKAAIVKDHVSVIEQIFDPINTTFQIRTPSAAEHQDVLFSRLLAAKGYGIRYVTFDQGANHLRTDFEHDADGRPGIIRLTTSIGPVTVSRDYRQIDDGVMMPDSPVTLTGYQQAITVDRFPISNKLNPAPGLSKVIYIIEQGL